MHVLFGSYDINRDRKSKRLNSSHVAISYAVFCLKKNKEAMKRIGTPDERSVQALHPVHHSTHAIYTIEAVANLAQVPPLLIFFFNKPAPADLSSLSLHGAFPF